MPAVTKCSHGVKCLHYVRPINLTTKIQRIDTRFLEEYNNKPNNTNNFYNT